MDNSTDILKKKSVHHQKGSLKFIALGMALVLVIMDQIFKYLAVSYLKPMNASKLIIPGVLQLTYVENSGAAFGLFRGQRVFLAVIVALIIGVFLYSILSGRIKDDFVILVASIVLAGGTGNLIDRITRGYVIDYLDIAPIFTFPVFNFADCLVVVGCILLMIYLLFSDDGSKESVDDVLAEDEETDSEH